MREDLEQKLYEEHPNLFIKKVPYGIDCEDGWFDLLFRLCDSIERHLENIEYRNKYILSQYKSLPWHKRLFTKEPVLKSNYVIVDQVKEKFGGLRFYTSGEDKVVRGMIDMAELMSYGICEYCGNKGKTNSANSGWIKTTCQQHRYLYRDPSVKDKKNGAIALDFDGVINSYKSNFVAIDYIPDPPVPGSIEAIREYIEFFDTVYIYSTRNEQVAGRNAIYHWLHQYGLEKEILDSDKLSIVSGKPIAKIYLDDRAWHFDGEHFPTIDEIKYYKPWHGGSSSSQK